MKPASRRNRGRARARSRCESIIQNRTRIDLQSWTNASTILGQDDVPMSYDIQENQEPHYAAEENGDFEHVDRVAPLAGHSRQDRCQKGAAIIGRFRAGRTAATGPCDSKSR
jgi:hypothetical protein